MRKFRPEDFFQSSNQVLAGSGSERDRLRSRLVGDRESNYVRATLNQFFQEWDGLSSDETSTFVVLATNRPYDLDPAALRRASTQIFIDVPKASNRRGIIGCLLKGEKLAKSIEIEMLVGRTRSFTGSDLKNLCVNAALTCLSEQTPDEAAGKYPESRVLEKKNLIAAFKKVVASKVSTEDADKLRDFRDRVTKEM